MAPKSNRPDVVLGIDLGTTRSVVSWWDPESNRARTIRNPHSGEKNMPSAVRYRVHGNGALEAVAVGTEALHPPHGQDQENDLVVTSVKRLMGRRWDDPTVRNLHLAFGICEPPLPWRSRFPSKDELVIHPVGAPPSSLTGTGCVSPTQVSAAILGELKTMAEDALGCTVTRAVVTVPAYFREQQREATRAAGTLAGLDVVRTLSEPMAAAMSYGLFVAGPKKTVMVVDFGGGTFDISLLDIEDGQFDVRALGGDNQLGGDDVDRLVMDKLAGGEAAVEALSARERLALKAKSEQIKVQLSSDTRAQAEGGLVLSRAQLEELIEPLVGRCCDLIAGVLEDAEAEPSAVQEVVLVGGSTAIPLFRTRVHAMFPHLKELCVAVRGDRAVAEGAAIQAALVAGVDTRTLAKVLMLDALPYTLGVEAGDGEMLVMLPRNSRIPVSHTERFATMHDAQPAVSVDVFEGEDVTTVRNNTWLGNFDFVVPNGSRFKAGERSMNVTFTIDADGILSVAALPPEDELSKCGPGYDPATGMRAGQGLTGVWALALYVLLLFAAFVWAKVTFAEMRPWEAPPVLGSRGEL